MYQEKSDLFFGIFTTPFRARKTAVFSPMGARVCECKDRLYTAGVRTPAFA